MIPKKIHYCWFGGGEKNLLIQKCMKSWQEHLSGYTFKLWDEKNSPMHHPYVKKAIEKKQYAFASDYVRLHALYHEGGIYLDTDMEIVKSLDFFLSNTLFLGRESSEWINAGIIGSEAKHPAVKKILDRYDTLEGFQTIPKIITPILQSCMDQHEITIYEESYFYPYYPFSGGTQLMAMDIKPNTHAIHHWGKSWDSGLLTQKGGTGLCVLFKNTINKMADILR